MGGAAPKTVRALFDFNAENEQELSFKQNDVIEVLQVLDDNWMEGSVNGKVFKTAKQKDRRARRIDLMFSLTHARAFCRREYSHALM